MPNPFNPFSGLGKIESYIRWNRFRGTSFEKIAKASAIKFGSRFGKTIRDKIANQKLTERAAQSLRQSGPSKEIESITLPLGGNKSKNIRITARVQNPQFKGFGPSGNSQRAMTFDLPRRGTKRQLATTLRDKILEAFFSHYDIGNKYLPDFRKRFGDVDILEIEGV